MIFSWYVSALFTIFFWGVADLYYKKGTDPDDQLSHLEDRCDGWLSYGLQAFLN